jgi:DNA-binding NtrC family response regulator
LDPFTYTQHKKAGTLYAVYILITGFSALCQGKTSLLLTWLERKTVARLDARVKTQLSAYVAPLKGKVETVANVVELSLSGLLLDSWTTKTPGTLRLRLALQKDHYTSLYGDIVRTDGSQSAIQFYVPEREETAKLWQFIQDRMTYQDTCPYCDHAIKSNLDYCGRCGSYLNFKDVNYLDKHLNKTIFQRVMSRMDYLNAKQKHRVLNFIDKELLAVKDRYVAEHYVGVSEKMLEVFSLIRKVAPTENPALILGESGTGKELTAKAIHDLSRRKDRPFITINCEKIPKTSLERELFGYEKGAFRGALTSEKGKFEIADGGTIFLDEISGMPLSLQARLLRVLEERIIRRLGSEESIKVNVRVIASSSKILKNEVKTGRFLADLYRKINAFTIMLPPLRDRGEGKIILAKYYLRRLCMAEGVSKRFSNRAIEAIKSYPWPGNVDELIDKIRRAVVISKSDTITPNDLSFEVPIIEKVAPLRETKASIEKQKLMEVLEMTSHNIKKTSALLGVSRPTIYDWIKKYGIRSTEK